MNVLIHWHSVKFNAPKYAKLQLHKSKTRKQNVLNQGQTDRISLTHDLDPWPMTLIFSLLQVTVVTYSRTKGQSVSWIYREHTDRQLDGGDCIIWLADAESNYQNRFVYVQVIASHACECFGTQCIFNNISKSQQYMWVHFSIIINILLLTESLMYMYDANSTGPKT